MLFTLPLLANVMTEALGKAHPLLVHFPIALVWAAVLAEGLSLFRPRQGLDAVVRFSLRLATLGALGAVVSGLVRASEAEFLPEVAATAVQHRNLGLVCLVGCILLTAAERRARRSKSARWRWTLRAGLLLLAGLVSFAAHLGGTLVYGLDYWQL